VTARLKSILLHSLSFLLAGGLLFLALYGVDFDKVWRALRTANYWWLVPLLAVVLLSHLARSWRWMLLLRTLPDRNAERVSLKISFYSVMIGYMANYAAPRLGEVLRSGNTAVQEELPFSSVLGTVVAERVLDMLTLAVFLVSVPFLLASQLDVLHGVVVEPVTSAFDGLSVWWLLALSSAALLALGGVSWLLTRPDRPLHGFWTSRVRPLFASFTGGFMTLRRCPRRGALLVSTLAIWGCYLIMAHIPFVMLHMAEPFGLSLVDTWSIFLLGSLGIVVPVPGGTGSYHAITVATLTQLFSVAQSPAATYAVLTHAAQLVLYAVVGAICLMLQGTGLQELRERVRRAQEDDENDNAPD
jgi:uncharacterized protein (TIRG00374 family)